MREKFRQMGLSETVLKALTRKGFEEPTQIQERIIPLLLNDDIDVLGHAQTGTGKTAAFGIPLIEKLNEDSKDIQALILVPTRELALQVAEEINSLKGKKRIKITTIYGGQAINRQIKHLRKGVHIVVGTPGRIKDHIMRKTIKLNSLSYGILDEADEMLNMGFIDDIEEILSYTNENKRMLLFCATMPKRILRLTKKYMGRYKAVHVENEQLTTNLTNQIYFEVREADKFEALCRIIDSEIEFYGLVFCRTKVNVDNISNKLSNRGYDVEGLHGDISQQQRERKLKKLRNKMINILVATDVAARGIDIVNLTHVINFALPQNPEMYIHRIGRTGRAGKEGTAITFITPSEYKKLKFIKQKTKTNIKRKNIPDVNNIIKTKKDRIKKSVNDILNSSDYSEYLQYANDIIAEKKPADVLAAFIKHVFQDDFKTEKYGKIEEASVDKRGKARLFIAKGRNENMTNKKIVKMIQGKVKINNRNIRDVCVLNKCSFATVPFKEAEMIISAFNKVKISKGRKLVTHARARKKKKK